MPVEVRRVTAQDWEAVRALRLEALEDTPIGFLERLADAQAAPDATWQTRAARGAEGGEAFQVVAFDGGRPVATSVAFLRDGAAWLAAVYVSPAFRGQGLLAELVERCARWSREQGASVQRLQVHEDNARARAAYAALGFLDTGQREPYDLDPSREELLLERAL